MFYHVQTLHTIIGISDVDQGSCFSTHWSLIGFCIFFGHSLVSWKTKKQPTISRSCTEVEYHSMASTTTKLDWLCYLLNDLFIMVYACTLFCDNKLTQQIASNPFLHKCMKLLEIDYYYTRDKIQDKFLQTSYSLQFTGS